jgi:hypothetical protein
MTDYPVTFDITRPATNQKPAVFIRILGYLILGVVNWLEPGVAAAGRRRCCQLRG